MEPKVPDEWPEKRNPAVNWSSNNNELRSFDRTALLGLIQDLYAASKDNQAFLCSEMAGERKKSASHGCPVCLHLVAGLGLNPAPQSQRLQR